jgi:hypothetical protein
MNAARSDVAQTITAPAIQAVSPWIERPLETMSVMIKAAKVASRATPPSIDEPRRRS